MRRATLKLPARLCVGEKIVTGWLTEKTKRDFIARKRRERWRRVLSAQADHFAGAKWKEKASACCVRNDRGGPWRHERTCVG
jgi:hypothetical protein